MPNPSLAEFTLSVSRAAFLRATSFKITKAVGLAVYKSVVLGDTDEWHKPIEKALGMYPHREVHRSVKQDPNMMFGEAEMRLYALGDTQAEADASAEVLAKYVKDLEPIYAALAG